MEMNGSINDEADLADSSRSLLADTKAVQLEMMNPPHGNNNNSTSNNRSNNRDADFSGASGFGSGNNSPQLNSGKRLGGL